MCGGKKEKKAKTKKRLEGKGTKNGAQNVIMNLWKKCDHERPLIAMIFTMSCTAGGLERGREMGGGGLFIRSLMSSQ